VRRVIFFARYEASHYGSAHIDTQHLLLGLMRENMSLLVRFLPEANLESVRTTIDARATTRKTISTATDLPLSDESKRVLVFAAEEADRLAHKHIGTEHLFLGLLREESCVAAQILRDLGADASKLRVEIAKLPSGYWDPHIRRYALAKVATGKIKLRFTVLLGTQTMSAMLLEDAANTHGIGNSEPGLLGT